MDSFIFVFFARLPFAYPSSCLLSPLQPVVRLLSLSVSCKTPFEFVVTNSPHLLLATLSSGDLYYKETFSVPANAQSTAQGI